MSYVKVILLERVSEETAFEFLRSPQGKGAEITNRYNYYGIVDVGIVHREEWEKCFWVNYPSRVRCWECKHSSVCPKYVKGTPPNKEGN